MMAKKTPLELEIERLIKDGGIPYGWPDDTGFDPSAISGMTTTFQPSLLSRYIIAHFTEKSRRTELTKKELIDEALKEFLINHKDEIIVQSSKKR